MKVIKKHIGTRVYLKATDTTIVVEEKHGNLLIAHGYGYMVTGAKGKIQGEKPKDHEPPSAADVNKAREEYAKYGQHGKKGKK